MNVQQKLQTIQRLDKGKILRIVAASYRVEKNTVGDWRRNCDNFERFASNTCGAMTHRKTMKLAEYDKIDSVLFLIRMVIDARLSRSRDYMFLCWYVDLNFEKYNSN